MSPKTSAIAKRPKRPPTPAERLRALDPDLADLFDQFEADLDRDYDLAASDDADGVPPQAAMLDVETELAYELGRFDLAAEPLLHIADTLRDARDEASMVLGRVEQEIGRRTLDLMRLIPQAALPPPADSFDGGDPDEDFHDLRVREAAVDMAAPVETRAVGGWWRRVWAPVMVATLGIVTTAAFLLRGVG